MAIKITIIMAIVLCCHWLSCVWKGRKSWNASRSALRLVEFPCLCPITALAPRGRCHWLTPTAVARSWPWSHKVNPIIRVQAWCHSVQHLVCKAMTSPPGSELIHSDFTFITVNCSSHSQESRHKHVQAASLPGLLPPVLQIAKENSEFSSVDLHIVFFGSSCCPLISLFKSQRLNKIS